MQAIELTHAEVHLILAAVREFIQAGTRSDILLLAGAVNLRLFQEKLQAVHMAHIGEDGEDADKMIDTGSFLDEQRQGEQA